MVQFEGEHWALHATDREKSCLQNNARAHQTYLQVYYSYSAWTQPNILSSSIKFPILHITYIYKIKHVCRIIMT